MPLTLNEFDEQYFTHFPDNTSRLASRAHTICAEGTVRYRVCHESFNRCINADEERAFLLAFAKFKSKVTLEVRLSLIEGKGSMSLTPRPQTAFFKWTPRKSNLQTQLAKCEACFPPNPFSQQPSVPDQESLRNHAQPSLLVTRFSGDVQG